MVNDDETNVFITSLLRAHLQHILIVHLYNFYHFSGLAHFWCFFFIFYFFHWINFWFVRWKMLNLKIDADKRIGGVVPASEFELVVTWYYFLTTCLCASFVETKNNTFTQKVHRQVRKVRWNLIIILHTSVCRIVLLLFFYCITFFSKKHFSNWISNAQYYFFPSH